MKNNLTAVTPCMGSESCSAPRSWIEGITSFIHQHNPMKYLSNHSPFYCITGRQEASVDDLVSNRKRTMSWQQDSTSSCRHYTSYMNKNGDACICNSHSKTIYNAGRKMSSPYKYQATLQGTLGPIGKVFQNSNIYNIAESILIHWLPLVFIIWMIFKAIYDDKSVLDDDKSKHGNVP